MMGFIVSNWLDIVGIDYMCGLHTHTDETGIPLPFDKRCKCLILYTAVKLVLRAFIINLYQNLCIN